MKFLGLAVAFVVLLAVSPAHAQIVSLECDGKMPCTFDQFKIGATEWYNKADTNHDGKVDATEQVAFWNKYLKTILPNCGNAQDMAALNLAKPPTDKDVAKTFMQIDTNVDGKIDDAEDKAATAQLNRMCILMNDPQMQKMLQMFKQMQQKGANSPAPKPAQ